jgi:hypothetical protein
MGDLIRPDFGENARVKTQWGRLAAHFKDWVAPTLDVARIHGDDRASYKAVYRAMADQLATARAELTVRGRLLESHPSEDLTNIRREDRRAMTALFSHQNGIAVLTLRRALLTAIDANDKHDLTRIWQRAPRRPRPS